MKFIITTATAALLSTTAFAADAVFSYDPAPAVFAQVPAYVWTGGYVGLNAGYGGGKAKFDDSFEVYSLTGNGFVGGAQAGYNWQSGSFVYGVETDIQFSGINAEERIDYPNLSLEAGAKIKWFGTTRARLGYVPTERLMAYATGGVAYGKMEAYDAGTGGSNESASKTKAGWTVGAGFEYAVDNNWSLKTEYLYTDLGKMTVDNWNLSEANLDFKFHTVRAGINYKF